MEQLKKLIQDLNIGDEEKAQLLEQVKAAQKSIAVAEFKYSRTVIDKAAITNVLNASIQEIEKQKKDIEEAKNEIAKNMFELDKQKQLIEIKNRVLNETMDTLKEAQTQLVQSEKMASLGQLTAGVAHEINNPINFVSANIKPLKEDMADLMGYINFYRNTIKEKNLEDAFGGKEKMPDEQEINLVLQEVEDLLKGIEEGAVRTAEIVKGLRNFSRLDQHAVKKASINEGLESTLTLLHSTYKDRIEIIKNLGNIPEVVCFPGQINQVFMNLLSNAIQAIPGNGQIFVTTAEAGDKVRISIKDTGGGIPENIRSKIFDPFFTTKDVGKGTGLGLSISYGIIQKHNGTIAVESEPGKGSEFIITLPIEQPLTN